MRRHIVIYSLQGFKTLFRACVLVKSRSCNRFRFSLDTRWLLLSFSLLTNLQSKCIHFFNLHHGALPQRWTKKNIFKHTRRWFFAFYENALQLS